MEISVTIANQSVTKIEISVAVTDPSLFTEADKVRKSVTVTTKKCCSDKSEAISVTEMLLFLDLLKIEK